ncbi:hypothetical protein LINGRAHAP2_LOCUS2956 [Linum grandiflorum]
MLYLLSFLFFYRTFISLLYEHICPVYLRQKKTVFLIGLSFLSCMSIFT